MFKMQRWLVISMLSCTLVGCFDKIKDTKKLCADNPILQCEQLNIGDGQCKRERNKFIVQKFEVLNHPSDENKIQSYRDLASYRKCMEHASEITLIDQSALKGKRFESLVYAIDELGKIVDDLKSSTKPATLYFLWSQTGDHTALRKLLQKEGSPELHNAHMQYALATFYITRDPQKTLTLLNNALTLTKKGKLNPAIIKALAGLNHKLRHSEEAYVWTMVADQFNIQLAPNRELKIMFPFLETPLAKQLKQRAKKVTKAIKKGRYTSSLLDNLPRQVEN